MATQSDDIARLTLLLARVLAVHGLAEQTRMTAGVSLGELGKASGATAEQAGAWIAGRATPSQSQALAVFGTLYERASWREVQGNGDAPREVEPAAPGSTPEPAAAAPAKPVRRGRR